MRWLALALAAGCGSAPFPDYFEEADLGPVIASVSPDRIDGVLGGGALTITGHGLGTTRTVVVGGRNASILEVADASVTVTLPGFPAGGGLVDVALATDHGLARLNDAFTYAAPADLGVNEVASAALVKVDCPVEAWGDTPEGLVPLLWCGLEGGYVKGEAQTGTARGLAGELSGFTGLSALPEPGAVVVYGPGDSRPARPPVAYTPEPLDAAFSVTTARDLARDLAVVDERLDALAERYSWWGDVTATYGPYVALWDDEVCWQSDLDVLSASGDTLVLDGSAEGATGLWLGFAVEEVDDYTEGFTGTAEILTVEGGVVTVAPTGAVFAYDDYSGTFPARGVAGSLATSDVPPGVTWQVARHGLGEDTALGDVAGHAELGPVTPDLLSGEVVVSRSEDLEVTWTPGGEGSWVVVEIRVYDADLDDPTWLTEVARLVGHGVDATGRLTIPASALGALPAAPNRLDDSWDLAGIWAEMTVARHHLRHVPYGDGALVLDLVHAIDAPIALE